MDRRFLSTISAYYGNYDEKHIQECVESTANEFSTPEQNIIKIIEGHYPMIHLYIEHLDSDIQMYFKLSQKLINYFHNNSWIITEFLGEGASASVFKIKSLVDKKEEALVLQTNIPYDAYFTEINTKNYRRESKLYRELKKMQLSSGKGKLKPEELKMAMGNTFVEIYDITYFGHPYSEDKIYIKNSDPNFRERPILILELVPFTLDDYIKFLDKEELNTFTESLHEKLSQIFHIIADNGYTYTDIKLENIAVFPMKDKEFNIKLLDLNTFKKATLKETQKWLKMALNTKYNITENVLIYKTF